MSNGNEGSEISEDNILLGFIVVLALGAGIIPLGAMLSPVKDWLVRYQILIEGNGMLLEIPGIGAGLDLIRVAALAALVLIVIALAVLVIYKRRIRDLNQR
ncbi:hypothetical protein CVS30_17550 [Arthrobacter psychrolactophilus]|uniref:Uncharacterized protein n=1 Tax=Arthrobacter psychrolactophilus TaxID=92442 RepID=A0A2V5IS65_9MICC|nr:hypothetical protein [Arthrobacter psychrolactophilus]PYI37054.1 hypothetical protein CVS30_17550 [Arthrobacter psychrolactophilus]